LRTLRWRLTLWYGGMAAAILILLASILYLSARSSLIAIRQDDVRDTADSVSQVLEETGTPASAVGNVRRKDVRTVWAIGEVRREDVQVVIRDADGGFLAATPGGARNAPEIDISGVVYPEVRRDGRYLTTTFDSEEVPGATGIVYTVLPTWDPVLRRLFLIEVAAVAAAIALIVGFGPRLARGALKPLENVSTVAGELRRGKLGSRVNLPELKSRRDEVGELASSFDAMAESLDRLFEAERESKETLRRFVADASHELRTPLTALKSEIQLGLRRRLSVEEHETILHTLLADMDRLIGLSNSLLFLARTLENLQHVQFSLVRVDEVLFSAQDELLSAHPSYQVWVDYDNLPEAETDTLVRGDEDLLGRVVLNLLDNACKYSAHHQAWVRIGFDATDCQLTIRDEGIGMSTEEMMRIFEPFYRASGALGYEGFGVGLSICQRIVNLHQGTISVVSEPGRGSTFTVKLPRATI